jgi:hypothetical protein
MSHDDPLVADAPQTIENPLPPPVKVEMMDICQPTDTPNTHIVPVPDVSGTGIAQPGDEIAP